MYTGGARLVLHASHLRPDYCAHRSVHTQRGGLVRRVHHRTHRIPAAHHTRVRSCWCTYDNVHEQCSWVLICFIFTLYFCRHNRLFSYTACSDPGIAFAPRPAYNSSDEDSNVGISLVNAVQSHVNSVNAGDGERETFDVNSNGSSRSSSSKSDDHHYEPHAEEGMQGDIEDGLNHNNSHSDASLVPQNALNVGTTSGMSNRISISGNRIRVGNNGHTNSGSSHSSTSSSGIGALNHPSGTGGGNGHSSGGSLNGVPLPHPRLPPPALIECGRCQIDRYVCML